MLVHRIGKSYQPYPGDLIGAWTTEDATAQHEWVQDMPVAAALLANVRPGCILQGARSLRENVAMREAALAADAADAMTPLVLPVMRLALELGLTILLDISHDDASKCEFISGYAAVNDDGTRGIVLRRPGMWGGLSDGEAEAIAYVEAGGIPDVD